MDNIKRDMLVEARNIRKTFRTYGKDRVIINDFSKNFERGKMYVFKGGSGCGKSTLLSILSLIQKSDGGEILFNGQRVDSLSSIKKSEIIRKHIGIVFQDSNLLSGLTLLDNIVLVSLCERTANKSYVYERAKALMEDFKIDKLAYSYPTIVSGGERQRAGIIRAILNDPDILICDEPISSLDEENANIIIRFLDEYCHNHNKLVILSCHNKDFDDVADQVIQMKDWGVNDV